MQNNEPIWFGEEPETIEINLDSEPKYKIMAFRS